MQRKPPAAVIAWLDRQPANSVWTTAITIFEIEYGLRRLSEGKRRAGLDKAFKAIVSEELGGRILSFDAEAALTAGAISAALEAEGQNIDIRDVQIAGIAQLRQATVATRNVKHFASACAMINPWEDA